MCLNEISFFGSDNFEYVHIHKILKQHHNILRQMKLTSLSNSMNLLYLIIIHRTAFQ